MALGSSVVVRTRALPFQQYTDQDHGFLFSTFLSFLRFTVRVAVTLLVVPVT